MKMFFMCFFVFFVTSFHLIESRKCPMLINDFSQGNCTRRASNTESYYYYLDEETCVPVCKSYSNIGTCNATKSNCPPAYSCSQRCSKDKDTSCTTDATCDKLTPNSTCIWTCAPKSSSCMSYHALTDDFRKTTWSAKKFKPACDNEGENWLPKQCKGGIGGRCMCYDSKGKRIFGQALLSKAEHMTCACSRKKADLLAAGRSYVGLHCDRMGNFEKLQCDQGLCWCVETKTGELTSAVVPEKAMIKLPCFNVAEIGSQYLRQCESKKYAIETIARKLKMHGVKFVTSEFMLCDDDGSFGAFSVSSGIAYCTSRDNSKIENWQTNTRTDFSDLNCNCARDFQMYSHTQDCEGNGNYKAMQQVILDSETSYYCVDSDGFPKSDFFTNSTTNCSAFY